MTSKPFKLNVFTNETKQFKHLESLVALSFHLCCVTAILDHLHGQHGHLLEIQNRKLP